MNRRQFLGVSAGVTTGLLGSVSASFLSRNVGIGVASAAAADAVPRRARRVGGRVAAVDGSPLTVDLAPKDAVESVRLVVARRGYPDGEVVAEVRSAPVGFDNPGDVRTVEIEVPYEGYEAGRWFYEVYVAADGRGDDLAFVCESAPFRWRQRPEYGADRADRTTAGPEPLESEGFGRTIDANDYRLTYRWRDSAGREWRLPYRLRRSVHEAAVARARGYATTFDESRSNPYARDLTAAIVDDATVESVAGDSDDGDEDATPGAGELGEGEWFDLLVRFVQDLRYARDVETTGTYDYNRTVEETLVAGIGDCKDKTHLLAGLLGAPPLYCRTAMLFQPAHVLLGVRAADVPSRYDDRETVELGGREFLPIDGSLRFAVGEYPDHPITAAYGDGGWFHYDVRAIGGGLDRNVDDWLKQNFSE